MMRSFFAGTFAPRLALALFATSLVGTTTLAQAEELPMASEAEIARLGPEGTAIYTAAVVSLDRADIRNGYRHMTRVAMMAPDAIAINELASVLAIKQGRSAKAPEAAAYYDVAALLSKHVLESDAPSPIKRRVSNRLRQITQERESLTARDARRESIGNAFLQEYSRTFRTPTPTPIQRRAAPPVPTPPQQGGPNQAQFSNIQTGGDVVDTGAAGRGNYFGAPTLGKNPRVEF